MKTLKILDWPAQRFFSETHPFHKWRRELRESGIKVEFYTDHTHSKLRGGDFLLIHSRYFLDGWQDIYKRTAENEYELISFLSEIRKTVGKLIWFDAADSSGSSDFPIIGLVDVFIKKQVLKDTRYYTERKETNDLRIWLNDRKLKNEITTFIPCPEDQLYKIKTGWNIGLNDYRYFGYKMSRLSNYLSYYLYPTRFSQVDKSRPYDLTFRGTVHQGKDLKNAVSFQRNKVFQLFASLDLNIATGSNVSKFRYWQEMRKAKLSISPFGWGEICYRDFETFIAGAVLIKPSMEHIDTFPHLFLPQETYVPLRWDMSDLEEKLDFVITQYSHFRQIAENGQERYRSCINDGDSFINSILQVLN